jgi:hypothetical protein
MDSTTISAPQTSDAKTGPEEDIKLMYVPLRRLHFVEKPPDSVEKPDSTIHQHNDSGNESTGSASTPELPSTPAEEESQAIINSSDQKEGNATENKDSTDGKMYRTKIHVPGGEKIDVQASKICKLPKNFNKKL